MYIQFKEKVLTSSFKTLACARRGEGEKDAGIKRKQKKKKEPGGQVGQQ